jgi:hypothetical protein
VKRLVVRSFLGLLIVGCSCSQPVDPGMDGGTSTTMDGQVVTPPPDAWVTLPDGLVIRADAGPIATGGVVACQGHVYLCGNARDDDDDGLADSADPDCLGPCDNNESGFYLNIPGGDSPTCNLDCYFDQDQGSGNDTCHWDHRCDPEFEVEMGRCAGPLMGPPPADANCPDMQQSTCGTVCAPLVPNGCDCFGCCNLPNGEMEPDPNNAGAMRLVYRFIGSLNAAAVPTCTLTALQAASSVEERDEACHRCIPVPNCFNSCGRCELCLGRTLDDLPADCFPPDAGVPQVPDGATPIDGGYTPVDVCDDPDRQDCGAPGLPACPPGEYCITGCCTYFG